MYDENGNYVAGDMDGNGFINDLDVTRQWMFNWDKTFKLEALPVGTHTIYIYDMINSNRYNIRTSTIIPISDQEGFIQTFTVTILPNIEKLNLSDEFFSEDEMFRYTVTSLDPREVKVHLNHLDEGWNGIMESVEGPDGEIYMVTKIDDYFSDIKQYYRLEGSLYIPEGIREIGEFAFYSCYGFNYYLVIPGSVTSIGSSAFTNCEFTEIELWMTDLSGVDPSAFEYFFNNPVHCRNGYRDMYEEFGFSSVIDDLGR